VNVPVSNFGGNVRFTPRHVYAPATEEEVLAILDRHAGGKVRVVGALHSWSPVVVSEDVLVDLRRFKRVDVERGAAGEVWANVGGGCRIKDLLRKLPRLADVTIASVGLITEQTVAGAIATATHGSGRSSMSHYVDELRVAAYDAATGKARIYRWSDGAELRAARCSLGCLGIILSVRIRCVPRYDVAEAIVPCATLDEVLAGESEFPLQQFFLMPHLWSYFVQRRQAAPCLRPRPSVGSQLYRVYWLFGIDFGLHLVIKVLVSLVRRPSWIRFFYRHVLSKVILTNTTVVDRSERMLVMEHELFRHFEMEVFVPARHLGEAAALVRAIVEAFDGSGSALPGEVASALERIGMAEELRQRRGTFTYHYPIAFRRVLPDDALIAMSGGEEAWYAISFITYREPPDDFLALASYLARSMTRLWQARLHWGKHFPLGGVDVERLYPHLAEFRAICRRFDPAGVFRNKFVESVLFAHA
jgi:FAD/FMN-containing dehydrogenase